MFTGSEGALKLWTLLRANLAEIDLAIEVRYKYSCSEFRALVSLIANVYICGGSRKASPLK